jgi:hypothetical protein
MGASATQETRKKDPTSLILSRGVESLLRPSHFKETDGAQPSVLEAMRKVRAAPNFSHDFSRIPTQTTPAQFQAKLAINQPGDEYEQEADRIAEEVVNGSAAGISTWKAPGTTVMRQAAGKSGSEKEEEKYKDAAKKTGEAFLETDLGKKLTEQAKEKGEEFITSIPGMVITGVAAAGAVGYLAATNKELPIGLPEIPLDKLHPGLKMKITYEGPVLSPTKAMIMFSGTFGGPQEEKKPGMTKTEMEKAKTAKMAAEMAAFQEMLKTPEQKKAEAEAWTKFPSEKFGPKLPGTKAGAPAVPSLALTPPTLEYKKKSYKLLEEELKLDLPGIEIKPEEETEKTKNDAHKSLQRKAQSRAKYDSAEDDVPPIVHEVLRSPGQPLDPAIRADMESHFGHDFSAVRIHADSRAAQSARAVNALAYTAGPHIAFGPGQTERADFGRLLAHELAHTLQQRAVAGSSSSFARLKISTSQRHESEADTCATQALTENHVPTQSSMCSLAVQLQPHAAAPARHDYVFIMGQDAPRVRNRFFSAATRYFRAHYPQATLINSERTLDGVLSWIRSHVNLPIGNLYIVAHANEDGTMGVGLNAEDLPVRGRPVRGFTGDGRLSVSEVRNALHPPGGGASQLPALQNQIDVQTAIHIRGCNIGQNEEMLNLLDESFGGAGRVIAPTHEQGFGFDPTRSRRAAERFRSEQEASEAMPPAIDPTLRGRARAAAQRQRQTALRKRQRDVQVLRARMRPAEQRLAEEVGTTQFLSGPMIERPGTRRFTEAEMKDEVDARYDHLSERARRQLAREWFRAQRIERQMFNVFRGIVPSTSSQARSMFAGQFRDQRFRPDPRQPVEIIQSAADDTITFNYRIEGTALQGGERMPSSFAVSVTGIPTDNTAIAHVQNGFPNPDDYTWRVARQQSGARLLVFVYAERVRAYLHHRSLGASPHEPFDPTETDPRFYGESTFAPQ